MQLGILSFGSKMTNIGDIAQKLGVMDAYASAGIDAETLPRIYAYDLNAWQEDTAFIMSGYFDVYYRQNMFPIADKGHPFYLGFHCVDEKRMEEIQRQTRQPLFIGCRDLASYRSMKRVFGPEIPVFMSGCFSLLQERRSEEPDQGKVMLVDVETGLIPYIPKELLAEGEYHTHIHPSFARDNGEADRMAVDYVRNWFAYLKKNAKLVITSRLHCALPCVAMGIPVVVARKYVDDTERYSGYEKLFPVYMPDEYDKIDWNPVVTDIEWLKQELRDNAAELFRLIRSGASWDEKTVAAYVSRWEHIHTWFTTGKYTPYYEGAFAGYLSHKQKLYYLQHREEYPSILSYITGRNLSELELVIYGCGSRGCQMLHRYQKEISKFKSFCFVDRDKEKQGKSMMGVPIYAPEILMNRQQECLIIVAINTYYEKPGREIASMLANQYGYQEGTGFLMLDKLDSSARFEMEEFAYTVPLM